LRDQLEQEFSAGFAERHEAQLVDNQQLVADHLLLKPKQSSFIPRFHQFVDESGRGDKADGQALLAGGQPEAEGNVGLSGSAWAECYDILTPFDLLAGNGHHAGVRVRR
jgi:hypothetical protein